MTSTDFANWDTRYWGAVEVLIESSVETVRARLDRRGTVDEVSPDRCRWLTQAESLDWPVMALGSS